MCFSVGASFLAGVFLLGVGIATLRQSPRRYLAVAVVPLFFAIQQIAEGFLWIILEEEKTQAAKIPVKIPFFIFSLPVTFLQKNIQGVPLYILIKKTCIYLFLVFAFIVWPFWIPLACYAMETCPKRKKILGFIFALGSIVSVSLLYGLITHRVGASAINHHIVYMVDGIEPSIQQAALILYLISTIIPFFISSISWAPFFGLLAAASAGIAFYYWYVAFVSVWCFFAALISGLIFILIPRGKVIHGSGR